MSIGKFLFHQHSHGGHGKESMPQTRGLLITWAWFYDTLVWIMTGGKEKAMRNMTADLAQLQPGEAVLEVGCGTGSLTLVAGERVGSTGRVCGIDPAPQMLAVARRKAARHGLPVEFQPGVIEQLAFPDHSFDVVLSSAMMHHLPDDLKRQGLKEIARVLKPGGRLLIVDFMSPQEHSQPRLAFFVGKEHGAGPWNSKVEDLPALMKEAGFSQIESGATGFIGLGFALGRTGGE